MSKIILTAAVLGFSTFAFSQADSSSYYLGKAREEGANGRKMETMKQLEKAYSFNKTNRDVVAELATTYMELRRYPQAKEKFLQLESMGDHSVNTYKNLLTLAFNSRQFPEAIKYAQLVKKADPAQNVSYFIGKAHYETENLGEAIKFLDAASKEEPANAEVPYMIARAYADMQNFKQAIPYFQKAVALKPTDSRWIYEMALIYYGMNDDKNALKYMLEAGEKGYRKDNEYFQNLSIAFLNAGQFDEGIKILTDALQRRPSDISLINTVAEAYYDAKKYDDAIRYWDQLLTMDKTNAEALYMIGLSYQKKGDKQKGMALCDKAIAMDPSLKSLKQEKKMPGM
jgi:tetratricopeptide (TPR) repeat protein